MIRIAREASIQVAGVELTPIVRTEVWADSGVAGVIAGAVKTPVAVVIRVGREERMLGLDGRPADPASVGLTGRSGFPPPD